MNQPPQWKQVASVMAPVIVLATIGVTMWAYHTGQWEPDRSPLEPGDRVILVNEDTKGGTYGEDYWHVPNGTTAVVVEDSNAVDSFRIVTVSIPASAILGGDGPPDDTFLATVPRRFLRPAD